MLTREEYKKKIERIQRKQIALEKEMKSVKDEYCKSIESEIEETMRITKGKQIMYKGNKYTYKRVIYHWFFFVILTRPKTLGDGETEYRVLFSDFKHYVNK